MLCLPFFRFITNFSIAIWRKIKIAFPCKLRMLLHICDLDHQVKHSSGWEWPLPSCPQVPWLLPFSASTGSHEDQLPDLHLPPNPCVTKGQSLPNLHLSFPRCLIRDLYLIKARIHYILILCESVF